MEQKMQREEDHRMGLRLYKDGKYEAELEKFESVLGSKPANNKASIASYNVTYCYSKLERILAGISALEDALKAGYEDFKRIRTDQDLENEEIRGIRFPVEDYDELFINENTLNAIKSLFEFRKK